MFVPCVFPDSSLARQSSICYLESIALEHPTVTIIKAAWVFFYLTWKVYLLCYFSNVYLGDLPDEVGFGGVGFGGSDGEGGTTPEILLFTQELR